MGETTRQLTRKRTAQNKALAHTFFERFLKLSITFRHVQQDSFLLLTFRQLLPNAALLAFSLLCSLFGNPIGVRNEKVDVV